jgi:hypothetical protein
MKVLIASIASLAVGAIGGVSLFVVHYDHASAPQDQHCWHEINRHMPTGVEKICMSGGAQ